MKNEMTRRERMTEAHAAHDAIRDREVEPRNVANTARFQKRFHAAVAERTKAVSASPLAAQWEEAKAMIPAEVAAKFRIDYSGRGVTLKSRFGRVVASYAVASAADLAKAVSEFK